LTGLAKEANIKLRILEKKAMVFNESRYMSSSIIFYAGFVG